jgi:dTDP-4-dehydrorhamnose reductase
MVPVLITGAGGRVGRAFARLCGERYLAHRATTRAELDISEPDAIARALDRHEPWLVVNAAGYVAIDDAEDDAERCRRDNVLGPERLARACARRRIALVTFSSDLVFDGRKAAPYVEADPPAPLGVYGRSQHEAEARVLDAHPDALIARTSALFDAAGDVNFVTTALGALAAGREVRAAHDLIVSPTYVPDLVHACLDLAIDGAGGVWHLANAGAMSWAELARRAAALAGYRADRVEPIETHALARRAPRPAFRALGSTRGVLLPPLDDALRRFHHARRAWLAGPAPSAREENVS